VVGVLALVVARDNTRVQVLRLPEPASLGTFAHLGAFTGQTTANTDGIIVTQAALPGQPAGAMVAVHDDHGVGIFDWRDIASAIGLEATCEGAASPASSPPC